VASGVPQARRDRAPPARRGLTETGRQVTKPGQLPAVPAPDSVRLPRPASWAGLAGAAVPPVRPPHRPDRQL